MIDVNITTTQTFTLQQVVDLLTTGIEGGMCSWIGNLDYDLDPVVAKQKIAESDTDISIEVGLVKYAQPNFFLQGGKLVFRFDSEDDGEGDCTGRKKVGPEELAAGLQIMADKYPTHFADFSTDNTDAITGDVFLQCVILGDVIYG